MKNKLSDSYKGFLIGLIVTIPGFSIGTLAIILNIYERLINDFSDLFKHPFKIIKKDLFLGLGFIVGFVLDIILLSYLLEHFPMETVCFFVGLVISSILPIFKNGVKNKKNNNYLFEIITCICTLSLLVVVTLLNAGASKEITLSFGFVLAMLLSGMIGAGLMIIPGISGSLIVLSIGYYDSIINSLKGVGNCIINWDFTNFPTFSINTLAFIIGCVLGLVIVSKLLKILLDKCASIVYFGILGLLIGSPFAILYLTINKYTIDWNNAWMYIIGSIMIILGIGFGFFANKLENKNAGIGIKNEK